MSRNRIVKLCMGPAEAKKSRRSAILGGTVISDYVDPVDNQRYVVVECAKPAVAAKKGSPKARVLRQSAQQDVGAAATAP